MTIMDAGLREQRAQARVRRRAERLEARERRTRSVRKSDGVSPSEYFSKDYEISDGELEGLRKQHTFKDGVKNFGNAVINSAKRTISNTFSNNGGPASSSTGTSTTSTPTTDSSGKERKGWGADAKFIVSGGYIEQGRREKREAKEKEERDRKIKEREKKYDYLKSDTNGGQQTYDPSKGLADNILNPIGEKRDEARRNLDALRGEKQRLEMRISEGKKSGKVRDENGQEMEYNPKLSLIDENKLNELLIEEAKQSKVYEAADKEYNDALERVNPNKDLAGPLVDEEVGVVETEAGPEHISEEGIVETGGPAVTGPEGTDDEEAYAKEMEQTRYNIMRDNAGKFLTSMAGAAIDNLDKINTAGWDLAGNMIKTMFTRPEVLSSTSRIIGSAMTMTDTMDRMAEDTSKRYGIAVQADPELVKDTIKYKAYKRAKEADGQVMGNALRVMDNSLKSMGVQDITQLDSTQLSDYSDILTGEMERIRDVLNADAKVRQTARGAGLREEMKGLISDVKNYIGHDKASYIDPGWNGRLSGEDRALLTKTYNVLVDHMKELTKQSSVLSREEKARIAEARVKQKEKRKEQYKASPIGWALEAVYPGFTMDVNSNTGLPIRVEDWGKLERYIASELAAAEKSGNFIRPREDYEKALKYIKDAKQMTHEARHKDIVDTYKASPIEWALRAAFPEFKTPVNEATGLPARLSDYKRLSTTIRTMMRQDKESGEFRHSPQEYQDALDMIARSKEAIEEQRATSKVQSYGILAEDLVRQVPGAAKGIINAAKTGRWSHGVDASLRFLKERINLIKTDPKNAGDRYLNDPEYKVAYCMYNSALLSKQVTQLMDKIMPVMVDQREEGTDEEKKAAKAQQDQDLLRLSQMMYEMRDVFPVDANMAKKVDLVAPNGQDAEFKLRKIHEEMGHISDRYKAMSTEDNPEVKVEDPDNINDEVDDTKAGEVGDTAGPDDAGINTDDLVKLFTFVDDDSKVNLLNSGVATLNLMDFMDKRGIKITPAAARKIVDDIYQDLEMNLESINGEEEEVKGLEIVTTPESTEIYSGGGKEQEQEQVRIPAQPRGRAKQPQHELVGMMKEFNAKSLGERYGMVAKISEQLENIFGDEYKKHFSTDENGLLKIAEKGKNQGKIVVSKPVSDIHAAIRAKGFETSPLTSLVWFPSESKGRTEKPINESDRKMKEYLENSGLLNFVKTTEDNRKYLPIDKLYDPDFIEKMQGIIEFLGEKPVDSFAKGLKAAGAPIERLDRPKVKEFIKKLYEAKDRAKARLYREMPDLVTSKFLEDWSDGDLANLIAGYFSKDWSDPERLGLKDRLMDEVYGEFNTNGYRDYIKSIDPKALDEADSKLKGLFAKAYVDKMLERYIQSIESGDVASKEDLGRFLDSAFAIWGDYIRGGKDPKNSLADLKKVYSITQPGEEDNQRGRLAFTNYITGQKEDLRSDDQEYKDRYQGFENKLREYLDTIPYTLSQETSLDGKGDTVPPENNEGEFDNDDAYIDQEYSEDDIDAVKDWIGENLARAQVINDADFDYIMKSMYEYAPDWKENLSTHAKAAIIGFAGDDPIPENQIDAVEKIIGIANRLYPGQSSDRREVKPPEQGSSGGSNPGGKPEGADEDITDDKIAKWVQSYNNRKLGTNREFMEKLGSYTGYNKDNLSKEQLAAIYGYARSIKDWDTKVKNNISKIYRHLEKGEDIFDSD